MSDFESKDDGGVGRTTFKPGDLAWWVTSRGERFPVEVLEVEDHVSFQVITFRHDRSLSERLLGMLLFRSPRRLVARFPEWFLKPRTA